MKRIYGGISIIVLLVFYFTKLEQISKTFIHQAMGECKLTCSNKPFFFKKNQRHIEEF